MLFRSDGKVAIITGAARGQGAVAAQIFAKEGASLVISDILPEIEQIATQIPSASARVEWVQADTADKNAIQTVVEKAIATFGRIDILYNNAGVILGKSFQETTLEEWERIIRIDLTGPFLMSQAENGRAHV